MTKEAAIISLNTTTPAKLTAVFPLDLQQAGLPPAIEELGEGASLRFIEFFTSHIRNKNTRAAYARAVWKFFQWCPVPLHQVTPVHVGAWVEQLTEEVAAPTVKQHLAAVRMLFDFLILGQIMPSNPAHAVRGPKHVVKKGKTPILSAPEVRRLLDSIDTSSDAGKRDKALLGTLFYTFARISAVVGVNTDDVYVQDRKHWIRFKEKGGKAHEMPCHHSLDDYLHEYREHSTLGTQQGSKIPLFQSIAGGRGGHLTGKRLTRQVAYNIVERRLRQAGIETKAGNHMFRASGITIYLDNGGTLEHAQQMAAHESPRTTKLYDRTNDTASLDEVERIII